MIDKDSCKSSEYIEDYRNQIRDKFLSNKRSKKELLNVLSEEERLQGKEKEINDRYNADMKNFVNELKSDENFAVCQKKYSEDMKEIRKLLNDTSTLYGKKGEKAKRNYVSKLFPKAKNAAFGGSMEWDNFLEDLGIKIKKLNESEKEKAFGSLEKIFSNKESFLKAINELKNGIKSTTLKDRSMYVAYSLFFLFVAGLGVGMLDGEANHLLVKLFGASRFVHGTKKIGSAVKDLAITGGDNDVNKIIEPHKFDYGLS